jgi:peptidyl-prolyl cis-trans isomerase SurA
MRRVILGLLFLFSASVGFSQKPPTAAPVSQPTQPRIVADKIVGIVGDKIVLKSEIVMANQDIVRQGGQAQEECSILDGMLTQKALVLQAEKDSIPVTDEQVEAEIDQKIRYFIAQYGSKEALEQISGQSVYQLKDYFREPIREQRLAQGMRDKIVEDIKITPTEVKEYYDKIPKDHLLFYESQLQIGQIVIYPKPSRDIELLAIDELNDYKKQVEAGTRKFETLAELYSNDPGSKGNGGLYEINRNDNNKSNTQWDPMFFAAVFRLKDGQVSPVVKSKMGYHIIQMVKREGDDATIRHILIIPQITDAEAQVATLKLDSIRDQLIAGRIGFGEAVARFSDEETAKFTAGRLLNPKNGSTYLTYSDLDKEMTLLLKNSNLKPGEFSKPTVFTDDKGKKGVRIVYLNSKSDPHQENLKDDYNTVAERALIEKKNEVLQKWFMQKIPTYYVFIDGDYKDCANLGKWQKSAANSSK